MKKIIKGKVYDTDTAQKVAEYSNNYPRSDLHFYEEELYRKKTGEFFLYGSGNAASKYSRSCGQNEWCGDERIEPITYDEAQHWAEEHLDGDDYISIFGEPEEDSTKTALNIYLRTDTAAKLKAEAGKQGVSIGELIEKMMKED